MEDLAPGFRFYPTEEELVSFYLQNKLRGRQDLDRVIPVLYIYEFNPWDLPHQSRSLFTLGSSSPLARLFISSYSFASSSLKIVEALPLSKLYQEAILMELKHANDEVLKNESNGDSLLKDSELFKKQYATVLLQLKEASDQVSSALLNLRQRNTYPGNSLSPWLKPLATSSGFNAPTNSADHPSINYQESGPNVVEIVKDSRFKAHTMVDAAIQAMSSIKDGEDAFKLIGEALDSFDKHDCVSSVMKSPEQVNGGIVHQQQFSSTSETLQRGFASGTKLRNDSDGIEAQIPSELITSCVATLLMVQMCTERQYPPADVAQILDSAVTSLHPCCPQNLPIYREIQMCMGRIKTQILALVPT